MTIRRIHRTLVLEYVTDRDMADVLVLTPLALGCASIYSDKYDVIEEDVPQKIALAEAEASLGIVTYAEALATIEAQEAKEIQP